MHPTNRTLVCFKERSFLVSCFLLFIRNNRISQNDAFRSFTTESPDYSWLSVKTWNLIFKFYSILNWHVRPFFNHSPNSSSSNLQKYLRPWAQDSSVHFLFFENVQLPYINKLCTMVKFLAVVLMTPYTDIMTTRSEWRRPKTRFYMVQTKWLNYHRSAYQISVLRIYIGDVQMHLPFYLKYHSCVTQRTLVVPTTYFNTEDIWEKISKSKITGLQSRWWHELAWTGKYLKVKALACKAADDLSLLGLVGPKNRTQDHKKQQHERSRNHMELATGNHMEKEAGRDAGKYSQLDASLAHQYYHWVRIKSIGNQY